ncbi:MAG TPA: ABC transporter ATP-binding protein [Syntrophomonas sp.]|nr:ABC transporter ATP-binding protein [Syntrophomonas sp.]
MAFVLDKINKGFGGLEVIKDLSMQEEENRIVCILGPSGAGKTTLLNLMSGVMKADSGQISGFSGHSISYLFQETRLLPWKTVRENIDFVLKDKLPRHQREQTIARYLETVELSPFASYYPARLSGGMKQRVSIARAFAYPADVLLMDEPFKGLDTQLKMSLIKSFIRLWTLDRRSVFFVTHDIQEAVLIGHLVYVLTDRPASIKGRIINPVPHEQRDDSNAPELQSIEQAIYQLVTL